jgi:16S rRNA (guanine527-N7)-methyltransferase
MNRKRPRQLGKKHQGMHAEGRKNKPARPGAPGLSRTGHPEEGRPRASGAGRPGPMASGPAAGGTRKTGGKTGGSGMPGRSGRPDRSDRHDRSDRASAGRPTREGRPPLSRSTPRSLTPRPGSANARQAWGHSEPPSRRRLEELLHKHGVTLPAAVLDKVWEYHGILRRNNGDLDLTRLIGFETIVQRHYADCLILHKMMKGKWPSPLVDIGTGAGFPGLMIKIASPATEVILSEPRNVRVDYLNNTIAEMGLKGISVFGHKFTSRSFQTPVNGVITRAFEPIGKTLPRLEYSLQVGGLAMFMKGPGVDEELKAPLPSNYKLVRDERYRIPATTLDRAFVVFERTA